MFFIIMYFSLLVASCTTYCLLQGILKRSQSCKSPDNMVSLEGPYVKDRLEGKGRVEYRNGDVLHAWFSAGTLHGFSKLVKKKVQVFLLLKKPRLLFLAVFQGG